MGNQNAIGKKGNGKLGNLPIAVVHGGYFVLSRIAEAERSKVRDHCNALYHHTVHHNAIQHNNYKIQTKI